MRTIISLAVLAFSALPAQAQQISPHVRLQCSGDEAIVRFEFGNGVAPLPDPLAQLWQDVPSAGAEGCILADGRRAIVLSGKLQTSEYSGGADPPAFFSLWIGAKKVITREFFKAGYGDVGPTYNSVHVTPRSLTRCSYPEAKENYEDISKVTCARTPIDIFALPPDPQAPTPAMLASFGTFSTMSVSSDAFCRGFVKPTSDITDDLRSSILFMPQGSAPKQFLVAPRGTLFPISRSGMNADDPFALTDWNVSDRTSQMLKYQLRHFDLTNSRNEQTVLRLWEASKAFYGDIYLYRKGIASQADINAVIKADVFGEPQIGYRKLAAETGWQVAFAPDEQFSRRYAMPLRIAGVTYLFVYSIKVEDTPTATLYRMKPDNTSETVCVFQEMRPAF
jgi:hypothetical protein